MLKATRVQWTLKTHYAQVWCEVDERQFSWVRQSYFHGSRSKRWYASLRAEYRSEDKSLHSLLTSGDTNFYGRSWTQFSHRVLRIYVFKLKVGTWRSESTEGIMKSLKWTFRTSLEQNHLVSLQNILPKFMPPWYRVMRVQRFDRIIAGSQVIVVGKL